PHHLPSLPTRPSSDLGRALLLVRTNREAAAAVGISPWRLKIMAFLICGVLAGVAGALTAPLYRSPPTSFQYVSIPSLFLLAIPVDRKSTRLNSSHDQT